MDYYQWNARSLPEDGKCHKCGTELVDLKWNKEAVREMVRTVDADVLRDRVLQVLDYISYSNELDSSYGQCLDNCDNYGHDTNCPNCTLGQIDMILYGWDNFNKEYEEDMRTIYEIKQPLLHPLMPKKVIIYRTINEDGRGYTYRAHDISKPKDGGIPFTYEEYKLYKALDESWSQKYWMNYRNWNQTFVVTIALPSGEYSTEFIPYNPQEIRPHPGPKAWEFLDDKIIRRHYAFHADHAKQLTYELLQIYYPEVIEKYNLKPPVKG